MLEQVIAGDLRGQGSAGLLVTLCVSDCLDKSANIFVADLKRAVATGTRPSSAAAENVVLTNIHTRPCSCGEQIATQLRAKSCSSCCSHKNGLVERT